MKSKVKFAIAGCFLSSALALSPIAFAQQQTAPPAEGLRDVTISNIPGVIAAGAKWTQVWQGTVNADGIIGARDGSLLFASEQLSQVGKLDKHGKFSVYLEDTNGGGALAIDSSGRIIADERTCTEPGRQSQCNEPTAIGILAPERKILADNFNGKGLGRLNDLIVDKKGGVYFNAGDTYYVDSAGKVISVIADSKIRTNGMALSRDEKTFYATNGNVILAFDVQPDGSLQNQRNFGALEAGGRGDGSTIDAAGRLYVSSGPGVQVFSPEGKYLGVIPAPRDVISTAFAGPGKKTLYVSCRGALGPDGKEFTTPAGTRNNAMTIYKVNVLTPGFKGRAK